MKKSDIMNDIKIIVENEGVYAQGFGMVAQAVMFDLELPIQSKTIYAYLASYAGAGKIFPRRETILEDLGINKDTYYKHLQPLLDNGYIKISKAKGFINKNVYTICNRPAKVNCEAKTSDSESTLSLNGINSNGYGNVPKIIMCDNRLSIKARGLIAFFYSLAQAGTTAFPTRDMTKTFLGLSKQTYYNALNQLIECGYITVIKRKGKNGRFCVNNYILNTNPTVQNDRKNNASKEKHQVPCPEISDNEETAINTDFSPCPKNSDNTNDRVLKTRTIPCPKNSDNTVSYFFGHYNNTIYNNTIFNINSYQEEKLDKQLSTVPQTSDNDLIIDAIHYLTQVEDYEQEQTEGAKLYCTAVKALCEMATCQSSQTYHKRTTTQEALITEINQCICDDENIYGGNCKSLRDLIYNSILCYTSAVEKFNIRNKINYLKAIIYDNILNFNL